MRQSERRQLLIRELLGERPEYRGAVVPSGADDQRLLLRALMNMREATPASAEFLAVQDTYLREETAGHGITDVEDLTPIAAAGPAGGQLYLWQGDITTLRADAIVNAANSGMCGCFVPNHRCIDNAIHTFAGIQLRQACAEVMAKQGHPEPTGRAKITPGFNLPAARVIHTVGPIVRGNVTPRDRELLASCYRSCLELAAAHGLTSIAFCCISTGEFCFPNREAARIAVASVQEFMQTPTSVKKVVFNVFKDLDREIYAELLGGANLDR
ncbi:protein-ADP-ribose hydrolase [Paratractidigestivibacter sp.]|uniref:protein-ADP-ribose hydrolase n=1 Tax=Paratractidigestivibacter sp. TaxID=2847316 RepID=UPI002AC9C0FF|nr:protein-ADP-ribose hydrolase [Paratractidigestivibacter sp.]